MARQQAELERMNCMHPTLEAALKDRPFPSMPPGDGHREARAAHLRTLRHLMPVPGPIPEQVTESEHSVPARDGYGIRVISYKPTRALHGSAPLIILFHEGGWREGDLSDEEFNARLLVKDLDVVCLNVEYRLAPEHPFPAGILDCWDVTKWAAANSSSLGADPTRGFVVGGSSAGGNIAAVLAHLSRNEGLQPPLTGQWLSVPFLLPPSQVPSKYKEEYISMWNTSDPVIPKMLTKPEETRLGAVETVLKADENSPLFSVFAPKLYPPSESDLEASRNGTKAPLARAYIQVAGLDPLRDHGLIYDRVLREEWGIESQVDVYEGFGHMFWTNWPELEKSSQFSRDMVTGIKWLLTP